MEVTESSSSGFETVRTDLVTSSRDENDLVKSSTPGKHSHDAHPNLMDCSDSSESDVGTEHSIENSVMQQQQQQDADSSILSNSTDSDSLNSCIDCLDSSTSDVGTEHNIENSAMQQQQDSDTSISSNCMNSDSSIFLIHLIQLIQILPTQSKVI